MSDSRKESQAKERGQALDAERGQGNWFSPRPSRRNHPANLNFSPVTPLQTSYFQNCSMICLCCSEPVVCSSPGKENRPLLHHLEGCCSLCCAISLSCSTYFSPSFATFNLSVGLVAGCVSAPGSHSRAQIFVLLTGPSQHLELGVVYRRRSVHFVEWMNE